MTFNDENIDLNPNLSEVAKNIKSIQKFFSGMDYFYGDVEQAKKDYFKYMTWYLATPFMAYLRYFASRNNYDTSCSQCTALYTATQTAARRPL